MFFVSGGACAVVEMLTKNNFMPLADFATKRSAYLSVLKLTKTVLTVTAHLLLRCGSEAGGASQISVDRYRVISEATQVVPNPINDSVLRKVAEAVSISLVNHVSGSFSGLSNLCPNVFSKNVKRSGGTTNLALAYIVSVILMCSFVFHVDQRIRWIHGRLTTTSGCRS